MGAGLATIGAAIVFGLLLSGMLPEAAAVIETPTPEPSGSILPSGSVAPSASVKPTPRPTPELIGTVTFGFGLNQSTREAIDTTDTFGLGDSFCHSVALPKPFRVSKLQEEILKIEEDGSLTIVQRLRDGTLPGIDPNADIAGFCVSADALINGVNGSDGWGTGDFVLRDYRFKGSSPELLAQGTFTLTE
jgi:hypothetical protein